jgi:hypothetical protein
MWRTRVLLRSKEVSGVVVLQPVVTSEAEMSGAKTIVTNRQGIAFPIIVSLQVLRIAF